MTITLSPAQEQKLLELMKERNLSSPEQALDVALEGVAIQQHPEKPEIFGYLRGIIELPENLEEIDLSSHWEIFQQSQEAM
jgi:hypothetical protein